MRYIRGYLQKNWQRCSGLHGICFFSMPIERFVKVTEVDGTLIKHQDREVNGNTIIIHNFEKLKTYLYFFKSDNHLPGNDLLKVSLMSRHIIPGGPWNIDSLIKVSYLNLTLGMSYLLLLRNSRLTNIESQLILKDSCNNNYNLPHLLLAPNEKRDIVFYNCLDSSFLDFVKSNEMVVTNFELYQLELNSYFSVIKERCEFWRF